MHMWVCNATQETGVGVWDIFMFRCVSYVIYDNYVPDEEVLDSLQEGLGECDRM